MNVTPASPHQPTLRVVYDTDISGAAQALLALLQRPAPTPEPASQPTTPTATGDSGEPA
jgi:hypothetical protein